MAVAQHPRTSNPSFIHPDALYSIHGFIEASGISYTRIHNAAKAGIKLPAFRVGRRKFIEGQAAMSYIRELAQHDADATVVSN